MSEKVSDDHRRRGAVVYIRQSTATQLIENRESQRRQYALAERARELGFQRVDVIDDDLGRSGSGAAKRPGFERLVALVCSGAVGAVFSIEASRLARNGREWHHLIDLCGIVGTLVVDADGVYDPRSSNDRLLLGLKGTMSEFELCLLRQRSHEPIRAKAKRGELMFVLPVGLLWSRAGTIERDPDLRVQEAVRLVFRKFEALGTVRQVALWFQGEKVMLPAATFGDPERAPTWKLPGYNSIYEILTNPLYAGAYAYGKHGVRTRIVDGEVKKTKERKPVDEWAVLIRDHHAGYVSWETHERILAALSENAHMKKSPERKAARGGRGLLGGLMRCGRCGRMMQLRYGGLGGKIVRYDCRTAQGQAVAAKCVCFGGQRVDQAIASALLDVLEPRAIEAALVAHEMVATERANHERAVCLELEQARYEAALAARRYEAVDPDKRLVAAELEARWNNALVRVHEVESRLAAFRTAQPAKSIVDRSALLSLADDLRGVWSSPVADMALKQRITRTLIHEIVANVDAPTNEIVLVIHWMGGRHTELRVTKKKSGEHNRRTSTEALDVVRRMAGRWPDDQIAATLNRLGLRTGENNTWNAPRVYSVRKRLDLPAYEATAAGTIAPSMLTLEQAAQRLGISRTLVRNLIARGELQATQIAPGAPWEVPVAVLDDDALRATIVKAQAGHTAARERGARQRALPLPGMASSRT